jgi:phage terminase large subunit-like protein
MKQEDWEKIHGKVPPNTLYIDLDEQQEPQTHGWTDTQIMGKSPGELQNMIRQRETGLAVMEQSVDNERTEISKLKDILERRQQLGAANNGTNQ